MTAVRELAERRAAHRLDTNGSIRVEGSSDEYVKDISVSGVFIRTESPKPVGTRIELKLTVILDELRTLVGEGEVVRVVMPGGIAAAGMGVKFRVLTEESSEFIERIIGG
jgi:uncharacterized protein (TIGR02266 family)